MDNSEDRQKIRKGIQLLFDNLDPRKYSIKGKIQVLLILVVFGSILLLGIIGIASYKWMVLRTSADKLETLRLAKQQHIESYFSDIQNQIKVLSQNELVVNAVTDFKNAFRSVADDDYYSSSSSVMENMKKLLSDYYQTEYLVDINSKLDIELDAGHFLPGTASGKLLHYLYIVNNTKPANQKHLMNRSNADASSYGDAHADYHPFFRDILKRFNYSDIYLVDNTTGDIIYSVRKRVDFATNLISDAHSNSNLARAYKYAATAVNSGFTITVDMERFYPAMLEPCFFIASPVFNRSEKTGVIIFQLPLSNIDNILHGGESDGERASNESYLVNIAGDDNNLRNNDIRLLNDRKGFIKLLKKTKTDIKTVNTISRYSTTALIMELNRELISDASDGYEGQGTYRGIAGKDILCSYSTLDIKDLNWIMVAQADKRELLQPARNYTFYLVISALILVVLSSLAGGIYSKKLANRINKINNALITLSKGEIFEALSNSQYDELGHTTEAANKIMERIHEASDFAIDLGAGKFEHEFTAYSENDKLGVSLEKMKNSLVSSRDEENKRKTEDEIRSWTTQGIVKFNDILRTDNDNIEKLSYNLIKNLVDYLSANQGGLFLLEGEGNKEKYLNLMASHAFDRRKYQIKQIKIGEGLAGNCVLEKRTVYLREIPEDYFEITSGLGKTLPRNLLIVPLKLEDEILGVIEIATLNELKEHEIAFVEQVAESIASTMVTVRLNIKTAQLLEESNKRSEELAQHEEEMRQNLEEMKATQEELRRVKEDEHKVTEKHRKEQEDLMNKLKKQNDDLNQIRVELVEETALLKNLMDFSPDNIYYKDKKSRFIRISKAMAKAFGFKTPEEAIGKSDFDLFTDEHARPAYNDEMEIIRTGKSIINKVEKETLEDGRINWVTTTKMPLVDENGEIIGTFGVSSDITSVKELENKSKEVEERNKKLVEELKKKEELIKNLKKGRK